MNYVTQEMAAKLRLEEYGKAKPYPKAEGPAECPKEIAIIAADNGYLFKIGCKYFVCQGDAEKATKALKRYLLLDATVAHDYSDEFDRDAMVYNHRMDVLEQAEMVTRDYSKPKAPIFGSFKDRKPDISVFNVVNGTVILDYLDGTARVKQGFFADVGDDLSGG